MTTLARQLSTQQLEQGLDDILASPKDAGVLELIVKRPEVDHRESVRTGRLDVEHGLVGDNWRARGNRHMPDGAADPERQLNIMNSRVVALVADDPDRRELAGDQLFVDMNLGYDNLPPGTRLSIGGAIIEITEPRHKGCKKFAQRFGTDAVVFVNTGKGRDLNLRGICARVVQSGNINVGDVVSKLAS